MFYGGTGRENRVSPCLLRVGILQEHGDQRRYRHLPDELSNRGDRHFIVGLHTFPPLHKVSGAKTLRRTAGH